MSGKILIVDDLATNRIILKVKLNAAYHDTLMAASGAEALLRARMDKPKLILLDMVLPDISGIEVCRKLRADPATRHIPVVIITASNDRDSRLKALEAGADEFLSKPLNEVILLARIRSLLRAHQTEAELRTRGETCDALALEEPHQAFEQPSVIGLIAENAATALAWQKSLGPHLRAQARILTPQSALSADAAHPLPDCYVVSERLGSQDAGLRLVADLRSRDESRFAAIMLAMANPHPARAALALDMGATDLITLPWDDEETALRVQMHIQRKRRADRLRDAVSDGLRLAVIDPLTGLYNRRFGLAHLERIAERALAENDTYGVLVLDLDSFKAINDTYGHAAGDRILEDVGATMRSALRPSDLVARIGGEEFLVVLPSCGADDAYNVAQRLRDAIGDTATVVEGLPMPLQVTASVGVAVGGRFGTPAMQVLQLADHALLASKAEGRNKVTRASAA